jgi:hypothetical protein
LAHDTLAACDRARVKLMLAGGQLCGHALVVGKASGLRAIREEHPVALESLCARRFAGACQQGDKTSDRSCHSDAASRPLTIDAARVTR